jgi:hypothetical protein
MPENIRKAVLNACVEFLKPIARLLIRNGIGYREFSDVAKASFVAVASDDYGIRGRKTNMSRVAVMTGLSRKEVKKIRDSLSEDASASSRQTRRPEVLLTTWNNDQDFRDRNGNPKRLSFGGPGVSFKDLVARAGGDIPPKAMLNELLRAGSVVREGEKLRMVSRSYVPEPNDPEAILLAGGSLRHLAVTINYNLGCDDPETRFFERRVYSNTLPTSQRSRFKKLAKEKADLLLGDLQSWLGEREENRPGADAPSEQDDAGSVGVGVFFFDDSVSPDKPRNVI